MSTEKWSQSSSRSWNSNGYGIVSGERHGFASGSKPPTTSPPTSSLKYVQPSGSRRIGRSGWMPSIGSVTT